MPKALAELAGQTLKKILEHLKDKAETPAHTLPPESRAPPVGLFHYSLKPTVYSRSRAVSLRQGHGLPGGQDGR